MCNLSSCRLNPFSAGHWFWRPWFVLEKVESAVLIPFQQGIGSGTGEGQLRQANLVLIPFQQGIGSGRVEPAKPKKKKSLNPFSAGHWFWLHRRI